MGMNEFPRLVDILSKAAPNRVLRFEKAARALQEAIEAKHIWNVDYEDIKYQLNNAWEKINDAIEEPLRDLYYRGKDAFRSWDDNDPRHNLNPALIHLTGYIARIKKVKNAPELAYFISVLEEAAPLGIMLKAVKPYIEKGRKPNPNPTPVDLTNTGTCAICQKLQKLYGDQTMVDHGYQISDGMGNYFGFRSGKCFGVRRQPFELSCEANREWVVICKQRREGIQIHIEDLNAGRITELPYTVRKRIGFGRHEDEPRITRPGDPEWDRQLKQALREADNHLRALDMQVEFHEGLIKTWKLKPLPNGEW